jgi:hypothetical protein
MNFKSKKANSEKKPLVLNEFITILTILLSVMLSFNGSSALADDLWHIETVTIAGNVGSNNSLALDANGYPHISYLSTVTTVYGVNYMYFDGIWHWSSVENIGAGPGNEINTSIALSDGDTAHICYYDREFNDLKYASHLGSLSWDIEVVDSYSRVGQYPSLALDSNDNPHISYYREWNDYNLKYAYFDTVWHTQVVDSDGDVGQYTSIALDSNDNPHISYIDNTNEDLKYARFDGSVWHIETVDSIGDYIEHTDISLDGNNNPHISYTDYSDIDSDLKYAHFNGSTWDIQVVDSAGRVGSYSSIAVDNSNNPHISYYNSSGDRLQYAYYDTAWNIEVVDNDGNVGTHTSICLDGFGKPHISYKDVSNTSLKYAYKYSESIPTLSEWGMLILALLLLATGTVALIRRKKAAVRA